MKLLLMLALLLSAVLMPAQDENYTCDPATFFRCDDALRVARHDDGSVTISWRQVKPLAAQRQIWLNNTEVLSKAYDLPAGFYSYHDPHVQSSGTTYQLYEELPPPDDRWWSKVEFRLYLLRLPVVLR